MAKLAWLLLCLLSTVGCGAVRVSVPQQFPVPLVDRLPLGIAVRLDAELLEYAHDETSESGRDWHIELGGAQKPLFRNLLAGMFDRVLLVEGAEGTRVPGRDDVAGMLVPSIREVQFSTPDQTRSDFFEVWIRYHFELFDQDGTPVADWPLTAYGQANVRNFGLQSQEPALQAAALAACRDAMAFFIVQFRNVPAVQSWLDTRMGGPS